MEIGDLSDGLGVTLDDRLTLSYGCWIEIFNKLDLDRVL